MLAILNKLRLALFANWGTKIVAFGLAILCWAYTLSSEKQENTIAVKIRVKKPNYLILSNKIPEVLNVKVFGSKLALQRLKAEEPVFTLDLEKFSEGQTTHYIVPERLALGQGVKITSVTPASLLVNLEEIDSKFIPLKPRYKGIPRDGYAVEGYAVKPSEIKIYGPRSKLVDISTLETDEIDLRDRTTTFFHNCKLAPAPEALWYAAMSHCQITVFMKEAGASGEPRQPQSASDQNFMRLP